MDTENKKTKIKFNILAIVCILIFCFAITPITLQNDTFYTIKIGELILNNGIDMQDHFSWHENLPYTYPHWAYDTGIYLIYHLGEITGIANGGMIAVYMSTILLTCSLGVLIYVTSNKIAKNQLVSFFLTLLVLYLFQGYIAARAQLLTFNLFVLTIYCIESFLENKKKRYLIGLIIISIIMANVHVAVWPFFFVVFLPYIAEYIIALIIEANIISKLVLFSKKQKIKNIENKIKKEKQEEKIEILNAKLEEAKNNLIKVQEKAKEIIDKTNKKRENPYKLKITKNSATKWLILVMVICAFTGLLTPIGDTPYTYLLHTMQGTTTRNISEHLPLTLYNDIGTMITLALIFAVLIFTDVKIKLRDFFMLGGLIFLSFMSRRQVSLLLLIGVFIFAKWVDYLFNKYDVNGCADFVKLMNTWLGKVATILIVILISAVFVKGQINDKFIDYKKYPVEASEWILNNLDVDNMKLFNEYNYGSYLLYRGIPVFIDSRADLYAPEFNKENDDEGRNIFSDYINISSLGVYYEKKFEEYEITHVILGNKSKLNMFISRDDKYEELYKDDYFTIYQINK